ncbi:MAG TPA: c-type cytochrome, partial [Puia sp.]
MIKGQGFLLISLLILFSSRLSPHTCFDFLNKTGSAGEIRSLAQENQAPQVHITRPASRSSYHRDARVPYSIRVSDAEDGESDYQEINPKEVLLKVKYLPDAGKINAYLKQKDNRDSLDLQQMIRSNCFNCHAVKSRLIGPSFLEIFNHYPHTQSKMDSLVRRISSGSSGIWGREVMPSHPELTKKEIQNMMNWIMS